MNAPVKLPIGIEDFKKIRTEGFYYVDKTEMITELLNSWGEVNLFTRPRRFGKSLNMSMLKYFFSFDCEPELFQGLAVAKEGKFCEKYMGKFPVISITLKGVEARNFEKAQALLCSIIGSEALRFQFLLDSKLLSAREKEHYQRLISIDADSPQEFPMSDDVLRGSLQTLSQLLCRHYEQKVILLIDEYDVPLDRAQQNGYYDEMVDLIRGMFGQVLKTNESLQFAVLTGYLTRQAEVGLNTYELIIPNREIRMIFTEQILDWFQKEAREDAPALDAFCEAFRQGDPASIERQFTSYLKKTISIRGTAVRKERKENFYHGILLGLLSHREDWLLLSNAESGAGYSDILIEIPDENTGIVIELKYSESRNMEAACQKALEQIEEKNYAEHLMEDDMDTIFKYGIACRRNACMVRMVE